MKTVNIIPSILFTICLYLHIMVIYKKEDNVCFKTYIYKKPHFYVTQMHMICFSAIRSNKLGLPLVVYSMEYLPKNMHINKKRYGWICMT